LDRLTGATPAPVADAPAPNGNPVVASPVPVVAPAEAVPVAPSPAAVSAATAAAPPTAAIPAANASPNTTPAAMESPGAKAIRAELAKAETEAQAKQDEALQAEREAQSVSDRIAALDRDVALESKLLVGARKKSDIAYQTAQALEAEKEARRNAGAPESELAEMRANRRAAEKFFSAARAEVAERVDRLNELQTQRADLQREELTALSAARAKQEEAKDAAQVVVQLKNPFAMHNVLDWLLNHGVRVGVILLVMFVLRWVLALASLRIVNLMIRSGGRGTKQEREDRANTLFGVFRNAVSVTIVVSGAIMVCEELGIAVGPLMGGAAVLGLAVAFGAQNLIRDYFYGFVILLENQYKLNDVLKIGELSGQVEQITLRMTVLRDLEGNVHFVPNGKIDSVTNMTHGWSRAVVEIQIAYREDAERVMSLLLEIAAEMRRDVKFGEMILEDAEMLGVESFGDSAVAIRFMVKTRPLSRWAVKRELLRRIKRRFAEQAVEIPFPQRVIHYRPMAEGDGSLDLRDL
ncbi:MAG TPA: mechanosensitive ion channel domain-containing protein, partial [Pirellulales bacterium]